MDSCNLILFTGSFLFLLILGLVLVLSRKKEKFSQVDPMIHELHRIMAEVHPKGNDISVTAGKKSFTINKKDVTLCLKDPSNEYFNKNMLVYVAIHELAHTVCKSVGHTDEFWKINDELLHKAEEKGFYDSKIKVVKSYLEHCGTH
jgi:hypothetical protein